MKSDQAHSPIHPMKMAHRKVFQRIEIVMNEDATIALIGKHGTDATHGEHINTVKELSYIDVTDNRGLVLGKNSHSMLKSSFKHYVNKWLSLFYIVKSLSLYYKREQKPKHLMASLTYIKRFSYSL
uniref:Uncharacterized protein n=1 Tax=Glossina palpalis gambiensis TaxID=67801 RepID=A0A1B0C3P0_9MUSC